MTALLKPFERLGLPRAALAVALDALTWPDGWQRAEDEAAAGSVVRNGKAPPHSLLRHLLAVDLSRTREDTEALLGIFWREVDCRGPIGWLALVVELAGLDLDIRDGAPHVPLDCLSSWLQVTDRVDADLIVAYMLARKGYGEVIDRLARWDPIVRIGAPDLDIALERGVSDLHVHLGALRSAQLTWARLLLRDTRLGELPRYDPHVLRRVLKRGDGRELARRQREMTRIEAVLEALRAGGPKDSWQQRLTIARDLDGSAGTRALAVGQQRFEACLRAEREMVLKLCLDALEEAQLDKVLPEPVPLGSAQLALQMHLFARGTFLAAHRQPAEGNPGLGIFRLYADTLKPRAARFQESSKLYAQRYFSDSGSYALQSRPVLRRLEVRLLPLPSINDYVRVIGAWEEIEKAYDFKGLGIWVRLAIHFKRSADRRRRESESPWPGPVTLQRELDRDAAVLFRFRAHPGKRIADRAARIARIDLAGQERDAGPQVAAFQMRLLRADPDALAKLAPDLCARPAHHHWLRIKEGGGHDLMPVAIDRPRLMLTCHAGEDFGHPLEGIWAMESARRDLKLEPGDTLGHGLAVVTDLERFEQERLHASLIRKGVLFDALLWLRHECVSWNDTAFLVFLPGLEGWLERLLADIYGPGRRLPSDREVEDLWEARAGPIPPQTPRPRRRAVADEMRWMECWESDCIKKREGWMQDEDRQRLRTFAPLVRQAQGRVLKKLIEGGIALELNPSSNYRISGAQSPGALPFVRLLEEHGELAVATLNSDDPGTFGTRIENEYAIVLHALRESGMARNRALAVLERLREVGMRHLRWREEGTGNGPAPQD